MMKPRSLPNDRNAERPRLKSGYQAIQENPDAGPAFPFIKYGIMTVIISIFEPKAMMSQGMIWTKSRVFNVARLAVLDVMPIHIPNQQRARRFPAVERAAARAAKRVVRT